MINDIENKIGDMHIFFAAIGRSIEDVLSSCSDEELYVFNVESYVLYSAIFGECKIRIARSALVSKLGDDFRKKRIEQIERRMTFVTGFGDDASD